MERERRATLEISRFTGVDGSVTNATTIKQNLSKSAMRCGATGAEWRCRSALLR